jgi:hypothetical protein
MNRQFTTVLLALATYLTQAGHGACSGDLLHDSGFDLWCGEELCSWQVEKGEIRQAPTWHPDDLGVELVGDDVAIAQRTSASNHSCVLFELVADIELDASVTLEMDLYDDGEVDFSQRLPTARWEHLTYQVVMPDRYQGIQFRLRKEGPGRAVLAQIRARRETECEGAPLEQPLGPLGASCAAVISGPDGESEIIADHDLCRSGLCAVTQLPTFLPLVCSECEEDDDCGSGVCGMADPAATFLAPYRSCVAPDSRALGDLCFAGGECSTGVCCRGVCSTCCTSSSTGCDGGRSCGSAAHDTPVPGRWIAPMQCDPQGGTGPAGEACLSDLDCASGRCAGDRDLRICLQDGRGCQQDTDCPFDGSQEHDEFGTCYALGTAGGTCE